MALGKAWPALVAGLAGVHGIACDAALPQPWLGSVRTALGSAVARSLVGTSAALLTGAERRGSTRAGLSPLPEPTFGLRWAFAVADGHAAARLRRGESLVRELQGLRSGQLGAALEPHDADRHTSRDRVGLPAVPEVSRLANGSLDAMGDEEGRIGVENVLEQDPELVTRVCLPRHRVGRSNTREHAPS